MLYLSLIRFVYNFHLEIGLFDLWQGEVYRLHCGIIIGLKVQMVTVIALLKLTSRDKLSAHQVEILIRCIDLRRHAALSDSGSHASHHYALLHLVLVYVLPLVLVGHVGPSARMIF